MKYDHDAIIIGGSYAGLSAALQLARARRRVLVIDAGERRNRAASSSHGFLTRDGTDPAEIAALGRTQLLAYPTVTWLDGRASEARKAAGDGFTVAVAVAAAVSAAAGVGVGAGATATSGPATYTARRLVLALGVADELPAIPGVAERWGRSIFACPYCHGYELDRGPIAVLATHPMSHHSAMMLPDWGPTTFFTQGHALEPDVLAGLERRGVAIEPTEVVAVAGEGNRIELRLADGRAAAFAGMFLVPKTRPASPFAAQLGCHHDDGPTGPFITTDAMKETTVPGVFACGDAALPFGSVAIAVADGVRAGTAAHQSMIFR